MRVQVILRCEEGECGRSSYHTTKNKTTVPSRMQLKKYCKWCKRHTLHKETK